MCSCVCVLKGVLLFLPQVKDPPSPKTIKEKKKFKSTECLSFLPKEKKYVGAQVKTQSYTHVHTRVCPAKEAHTGYGSSNM